jgi:hypothetical protein
MTMLHDVKSCRNGKQSTVLFDRMCFKSESLSSRHIRIPTRRLVRL